jgi:hypothetical protein
VLNGEPPTLGKIAQIMGAKHPARAHFLIERLRERGLIERRIPGSCLRPMIRLTPIAWEIYRHAA